jgi:hypothetical protein
VSASPRYAEGFTVCCCGRRNTPRATREATRYRVGVGLISFGSVSESSATARSPMSLQRWTTVFQFKYYERVKFAVTRWCRRSVTIAILPIVIPVCLIVCGPADAIDLAAKHDSLPNATHCPAHPDSNDSQDSQLPDRAPSCERTHFGVPVTSSSTYISDSHNLQLVVPQLTLVQLDVFVFPHSSTLLTHMLHSSISPLAGTLRL